MWVGSFIYPNMNNYHSCSLLDSWTLKIQEKRSRTFANFHVVINMNFDLKRGSLTFMVTENMLFGMDAVRKYVMHHLRI